MQYFTVGQKDRFPLVLLHGWGLSGEKYRELAQIVSKHFYVLVPDFPGFGSSEAPAKPWTIEEYARALKMFLDDHQILSCIIVGHSFGGRVGIQLASMYPKLVKAFIMSGTPGIEAFDFRRSLKRFFYFSGAKLLKVFSFLPPVKRLKEKFYAHRDYGKLEGVMKGTFLKVIREKLDEPAKKIKCPTLLLWGSRDQMVFPKDAEKMLKLIPGSYLKIFAKVGHALPYERPHEFSREIIHFSLPLLS